MLQLADLAESIAAAGIEDGLLDPKGLKASRIVTVQARARPGSSRSLGDLGSTDESRCDLVQTWRAAPRSRS
jgi:hypothetical protein